MFVRLKIISLAILLTCLHAGLCFAGDDMPRLRATVDRKTIFIGDRIRYAIEANYDEGCNIVMPVFKDDKIGNFEIKDSGRINRRGLFGRSFTSNWYSITSYSIGKQTIPQAEIKYRKKSSKDWVTVKTAEIDITVQSILAKEAAAKDIRDVKGPFAYFEINWWLVAALSILAAAITLIVMKIVRRKKPEKLPHETALEELEASRGTFLRNGIVKDFCVAASDCVRRYIERAFKLKAPEMTTEEFLNSLKDAKALDEAEKALLKEFLTTCDLVKFANYAPAKAEIDSVYEAAKKFIDETKKMFAEADAKR